MITPQRISPWQRVGRSLHVAPDHDLDQALAAAGLDWAVDKVPLRTADNYDMVDDFRAIRRSDTQRILGVVGTDYTPVQNRDIFRFFYDLAQDSRFTFETAGCFQHGRTVWAMAHLPDLGIRIGEDESGTYLFISNGHGGNRLLTVAPTTIRIVCQNTLAMAEAQARTRTGLAGGFTVRHTPGIALAMKDMLEAYGRVMANRQATLSAYLHLAGTPLTSTLERRFFDAVFGVAGPDESERAKTIRKNREETLGHILASPTSQVKGTKGTALSLLHAAVEYVDHERATRTHDGTDEHEARLVSATVGSGAALKALAWRSALTLAG